MNRKESREALLYVGAALLLCPLCLVLSLVFALAGMLLGVCYAGKFLLGFITKHPVRGIT